MRNNNILHARERVKIYESYYKPSFNPIRFVKSILGVLVFGSSATAHSYVPPKRKGTK